MTLKHTTELIAARTQSYSATIVVKCYTHYDWRLGQPRFPVDQAIEGTLT